jgi:predicted acetyltransferase
MYVGYARNHKEIQLAIKLAAETFLLNQKPDLAIENKGVAMSFGTDLKNSDVIVMVGDNNELIGTSFLIDRFFIKESLRLKGTFLSSICIQKLARGKGLSKKLMTYALEACERRSSDFAILIARKAVDYFYLKFGFWGISAYSRLNFKLKKNDFIEDLYKVEPITRSDLSRVGKIYTNVYLRLNGAFERSSDHWNHILWNAQRQGVSFMGFKKKQSVVGYILSNGSEIYEIGANSHTNYLDLLASFQCKSFSNDLTLHASIEHPILAELGDVDFSTVSRQCNYGGHMVKIIAVEKLSEILRKKILINCDSEIKCGDKVMFNDFGIDFRERDAFVSSNTSVDDHKNTCHLMGASYLSVDQRVLTLLQLRPFNILHFDQI